MAVKIHEANDSPTIGRETATRRFIVTGTEDEFEAHSYVRGTAGATFNGLHIQDSPTSKMDGASDIWEGVVSYGKRQRSTEVSSFRVSFNLTGGTEHITQSKQTVSKTGRTGETPPDFKGAIAVDQDGRPQGCEIIVPTFDFEIENTAAADDVTNEYIDYLYRLTGRTNSDVPSWNTMFAIGELLYKGASGQYEDASQWKITHYFAASPNATVTIPGLSGTIAKKGWEYLWVYYDQTEDPDASPKRIATRPRAAYVERVYDSASFASILL